MYVAIWLNKCKKIFHEVAMTLLINLYCSITLQINIYHCLPLYDLDPVSTNVTLPKSLQDLDDFHVRLPPDRLMRSLKPAMSSGRRGSASLRAATQAVSWGGAGGGLTVPQGSHSRRGSLRNIPSS